MSRHHEEKTYNYVVFDEADVKITAYADETSGYEWTDYDDPTASFSLTAQTVYGHLMKGVYDARIVRLKKSLDLQLKRWNLLTAGGAGEKITESKALEAYGRVISTVGEVNRAILDKYRFNTAPALTKAWKLAQAIKKGEATLASIAQDPAKYRRLLDKGDKAAVNKQARLEAAARRKRASTLSSANCSKPPLPTSKASRKKPP